MDYISFYVVGFISAFVFSLISIRFFLKLISKVKLVPFALYRIVLAIVLAAIVFFYKNVAASSTGRFFVLFFIF